MNEPGGRPDGTRRPGASGQDAGPPAQAGPIGRQAASAQARLAIGVFCGAKPGNGPHWGALARQTGQRIAQAGWSVVYGGGRVGLMGALADGALEAGGEVIGVIPQRLVQAEVAHAGCSRLEVVPDMASRKTRMIALADAFVALPGGLGTLDELFEVLTLAQLAWHDKPMVLLDTQDFWGGLLAWGEQAVGKGFVHRADWQRLGVARGIDEAIEHLAARLALAGTHPAP